MTFTVEQKSQLAKLLATENIRIEHQKIQTAMFDVKRRVMYLPIWKNMTGHLYDLLTGHEVGHGLYTPEEGWHNAISDSSRPKSFKNFLNVVEDARIEKKIQRRYPGLRNSFRKAYKDLFEQDFFKIGDLSVNELPFIDRLNLYTKSQYTMDVSFNDIEQGFVETVKRLETWDDVVKVSIAIFEYSKQEQKEKEEQKRSDEYDDYGLSPDDDGYNSFDSTPSDDDGDLDIMGSSGFGGDAFDDISDDENDSEKSESGTRINRHKMAVPTDEDQFIPKCSTDEAFRKNEMNLLDEKSKNYLYLNIPEIYLENIVTPISIVHEHLTNHYTKTDPVPLEQINELVAAFKAKNERYVSLLAKEFEMNKAAKSFSKSRVSETGDIDISKLSSYKFDDNIFKKLTVVPKGKSHGLILLLDYSGSMSGNMAGSLEQILILSMFCKKVNIPFRVFSFGDNSGVHHFDSTLSKTLVTKNQFSKNENDLVFGFCKLREYLNSSIPATEYSTCFKNMVVLYNSYLTGRISRPPTERLSNTPLISAIVACQKVMKQFKKEHNLDLTNLIIVHDGDADRNGLYVSNYDGRGSQEICYDYLKSNIVMVDKKNKYSKVLEYGKEITRRTDALLVGVLDWFKQTTGSKVFGFYLLPSSNLGRELENKYYKISGESQRVLYSEKEILRRKMKDQKFLTSFNPGYEQFYFILGGYDLQVETDVLDISGDVSHTKLKSAFLKMNKRKQLNRVFVNRFIKNIAA